MEGISHLPTVTKWYIPKCNNPLSIQYIRFHIYSLEAALHCPIKLQADTLHKESADMPILTKPFTGKKNKQTIEKNIEITNIGRVITMNLTAHTVDSDTRGPFKEQILGAKNDQPTCLLLHN